MIYYYLRIAALLILLTVKSYSQNQFKNAFILLDKNLSFNGIQLDGNFNNLEKELKLVSSNGDIILHNKSCLIQNHKYTSIDTFQFLVTCLFKNERLIDLGLYSDYSYTNLVKYFTNLYGVPDTSFQGVYSWIGETLGFRIFDNKKTCDSLLGASKIEVQLINFDARDAYGQELYKKSEDLLDAKNISLALVYANKYVELYPNSYKGYVNSGYLKSQTKDYKSAELDLTTAIELNSHDSRAYLIRGLVKNVIGKTSEACSDFKIADSLGDKNAPPLIEQYCK